MFKKIPKSIFVGLLALVTALSLSANSSAKTPAVAQIGSESYESLSAALEAAEPNAVINIISDISNSPVIKIDRPVTIEGNGHEISAILSGTNAVFLIDTSEPVIINNLNITTNTRAVAINYNVHDFTISSSIMNVGQRGVTINSDENHDSRLTIKDCLIQNSTITDYDQMVANDGSRGISLWEYSNSTITITNSTIQGFSYVINITASYQGYDSTGTSLIIDHSTLKGRAGINYNYAPGFKIDLTNSYIHGINNQTGRSESFADIVIEKSARADLNITDTHFTNFHNADGLANPNAVQYMLALRSEDNIVNISGDTSFVDSRGTLDSIFEPQGDVQNSVAITGGTFNHDISAFIPEGYQTKYENGQYIIMQNTPAPETPVDNPEPDVAPDERSTDSEKDQTTPAADITDIPNTGISEDAPSQFSHSYTTIITVAIALVLTTIITAIFRQKRHRIM